MTLLKPNRFMPDTLAHSDAVRVVCAALLLWAHPHSHAIADEPPAAQKQQITIRLTPEERQVPVRFQLAAQEFEATSIALPSTPLNAGPHFEVTFPSPVITPHENNNTVHCEYFVPRGTGKRPGVIVLHILGGDFELSRLCCRSLSMHGVGALFVKMPYYGPRRDPESPARMISADLEQTIEGFTQAVLDIRRATAWLAAREEIDPNRLGITGISLGGIVSTLAAAGEPRLQRMCIVLAGGNLPEIILQSTETKKIRQEWENREFDRELVVKQLSQVDPLTYAHLLRNRKILMFNAKHDTVVPPDCTNELWQALGKPEIHWWNANHYSAVWFLPPGLIQMSQFFAQEDEPPTTE